MYIMKCMAGLLLFIIIHSHSTNSKKRTELIFLSNNMKKKKKKTRKKMPTQAFSWEEEFQLWFARWSWSKSCQVRQYNCMHYKTCIHLCSRKTLWGFLEKEIWWKTCASSFAEREAEMWYVLCVCVWSVLAAFVLWMHSLILEQNILATEYKIQGLVFLNI